MKIITRAVLRKCASLVLVSALGLLTGCLYGGDPGDIQANSSAAARMEGVQLELIRYSMSCDSAESQGLVVNVGPGLEYPAEAVEGLIANCSLVPSPGVEVHVDDSAVIFDFSNIEGSGRFPDAEFEGYILDIVRNADSPVWVAALVDSEMSTFHALQDDLKLDRDRLWVNLAGRSFDSNSLLRIELYLADVSDPRDADSPDQI